MRSADGSRPGALVTGAARGIGYAIAEALASRGDAVTIADLDETRAREACAALAERGHTVRSAALDVTDPAHVHEVMRDADRATPLTDEVLRAGVPAMPQPGVRRRRRRGAGLVSRGSSMASPH